MAQTLTEIRTRLAEHGLRPKKRYGQNFLHDANQMRRILEAAAVEPGDLVLEVGAGTGALSEHLLNAGVRLVAVEIDADLQPILRDVLEPYAERVRLVIGDALAGKHALNPRVFEALEELAGRPDEPFKLVANLPYNIASPLLVNLLANRPAMTLAVVMVQREVAQRIAADPGGKDYGPLSVMVQAMCEVEPVATLGPGCFWPAPKVDSAVIRLVRRARPLTDDPARLAAMLHRLFSQRRKQLGTILGRDTPLPDGISPNARPETLSVQQIIALAETLPL